MLLETLQHGSKISGKKNFNGYAFYGTGCSRYLEEIAQVKIKPSLVASAEEAFKVCKLSDQVEEVRQIGD